MVGVHLWSGCYSIDLESNSCEGEQGDLFPFLLLTVFDYFVNMLQFIANRSRFPNGFDSAADISLATNGSYPVTPEQEVTYGG